MNFSLFPKQLFPFSRSFSTEGWPRHWTGIACFLCGLQTFSLSCSWESTSLFLFFWDYGLRSYGLWLLGLLGRRHLCKVILCSDASSWEWSAIRSKEMETMNFCAKTCQCPVQYVAKHAENWDFHIPADVIYVMTNVTLSTITKQAHYQQLHQSYQTDCDKYANIHNASFWI